jgi:hypothetical protein
VCPSFLIGSPSTRFTLEGRNEEYVNAESGCNSLPRPLVVPSQWYISLGTNGIPVLETSEYRAVTRRVLHRLAKWAQVSSQNMYTIIHRGPNLLVALLNLSAGEYFI